ncbi:MAG: zinc-dependent metalloprotease [Candidatus Limnocylindria bacterium]
MSRSSGRIGMGVLVGTALAAGATVLQREIVRRAGQRLIDWDAVRDIAVRRLGDQARPISPNARRRAEAFYRETLLKIEPVVEEEIGARLPEALEVPAVADRVQWVDVNLATFEHLFGRVEEVLVTSQRGPDTASRAIARVVNRRLTNQQLGFLMAFLARKVLGQYDVSLLAIGPSPRGRLYFVDQNVEATARALGVPLDRFRVFIALHEVTHAFEFEAYPWLRDHFASEVRTTIETFAADAGRMAERVRRTLLRPGRGHWLERMMSADQLRAFRRTQALMALLEGYSSHVMNAAGARLLPEFEQLHARFERRGERRGALERAIMRITGLDLKMEQYSAGERFVRTVIASRGRSFFNQVWESPSTLPSFDEIEHPDRWVGRMAARVTAA